MQVTSDSSSASHVPSEMTLQDRVGGYYLFFPSFFFLFIAGSLQSIDF